jgi:FHS family L-fucose permease-like MFS transporter
LANAMVWPTIWPLAIADLGDYTARGSAWLIMAIAGGAILPPLFGQVVAQIGYQSSYLTLIIGYAVMTSYGMLQYQQRRVS